MSRYRYMMVSIVACRADYLGTAERGLHDVMGALRAALPTVHAYFGLFQAGRNAGSLSLIHLYQELNDVDPAFGVYGTSQAFATLASSGNIALRERTLIRLDDTERPVDTPGAGYQSFALYAAPGLPRDQIDAIAAAPGQGDTNVIRTGTVWTGLRAGQQMLTIVCPTMDALVQTEAKIAEHLPKAATPADRDVLHLTGQDTA